MEPQQCPVAGVLWVPGVASLHPGEDAVRQPWKATSMQWAVLAQTSHPRHLRPTCVASPFRAVSRAFAEWGGSIFLVCFNHIIIGSIFSSL